MRRIAMACLVWGALFCSGAAAGRIFDEGVASEVLEQMNRGDYREAEKSVFPYSSALALRFKMELAERQGERIEADRLADQLLQLYRSGALVTSGELGQAAVAAWHLDRWQEANDLFIEAAGTEPAYSALYVDWGELYLQQYNPAEAESIFEDALKGEFESWASIRWNKASALLGLALAQESQGKPDWIKALDLALESDPAHLDSIRARALVALREDDWETASEWVRKGLKINSNYLPLLEVEASLFYLQGEHQRYETSRKRILAINPRNADLDYLLGTLCVPRRRLKEAISFLRRATEQDPTHWQALSSLGINLLREGFEEEGQETLEKAYRNDPFNLWTVNTLRLLDSLESFQRFETPHFAVKIDSSEAVALRPYVADLLERSLSEMSRKYGFQVEGRHVFEIYPNHEDFAVRALGLPGLGALGATFGRVVAMDSPSAREEGTFHWGSTLWHEVTHVVTLSLSDDRVPRWLTEGISMFEEKAAGEGWGDYLTAPFVQAYAEGKLLTLPELNKGFERPEFPGQLQLSYLQAGLAAEFLLQRFGAEKIRDLLVSYAHDQTGENVFKPVLGFTLQQLDKDFSRSLQERVAPYVSRLEQIEMPKTREVPARLTALTEMLEQYPDNYWLRLSLGRLLREQGRLEQALPHLEKAIDLFPYGKGDGSPNQLLFAIYDELDRPEKALEALRRWWRTEPERGDVGEMLATRLSNRGEKEAALQVFRELMYVTPFKPEIHQALGELLLERNQVEDALVEFRIVLSLEPNDLAGAHYSLARALSQAGQPAEAKVEVLRALEIAPTFQPAQRLLLELVRQ